MDRDLSIAFVDSILCELRPDAEKREMIRQLAMMHGVDAVLGDIVDLLLVQKRVLFERQTENYRLKAELAAWRKELPRVV